MGAVEGIRERQLADPGVGDRTNELSASWA
jgi:hypothetical protein